MDHPAQLRICHEPIAADRRVHDNRGESRTQFCSLTDVVWCWECAIYVCQIHAASRHEGHEVGD